jgi:hypothetical protein
MTIRSRIAAIALAFGAALVPAAPALAQYIGPTPPQVLPSDTATARPSVEVKGEKQTRGVNVAGVAVTGSDVLGLVVIGGAAVGGGTLIRRASRRRNS